MTAEKYMFPRDLHHMVDIHCTFFSVKQSCTGVAVLDKAAAILHSQNFTRHMEFIV